PSPAPATPMTASAPSRPPPGRPTPLRPPKPSPKPWRPSPSRTAPWTRRRDKTAFLEELPQAQQVEDARLDLDPAGGPRLGRVQLLVRHGDEVVAVHGQPHLRRPGVAVRFERVEAALVQPRAVGQPEV